MYKSGPFNVKYTADQIRHARPAPPPKVQPFACSNGTRHLQVFITFKRQYLMGRILSLAPKHVAQNRVIYGRRKANTARAIARAAQRRQLVSRGKEKPSV